MQFELSDNRESLETLGPQWQELEQRCSAHLFQSHAFVSSWYAHAGKESGAVAAVAVYREGGLIRGVFPGCVISRNGVRFLTWLGGFFLVDYGDVLFDPASGVGVDDFMQGALDFLRQKTRFHLCYFPNVRRDAAAFPYLSRRFREFRSSVAPYIALDGDFEQFLDSLKRFRKKQKSDTLRQIKRLGELGELQFSIVPVGDEKAQPLMEAFFVQKRWRFSVSGVNGVLFQPGYEDFYRDQARRNRSVHLSCLTLNGEIIATHVGYLYKGRFYYLMPSYDHRFGKYSPGRVLAYYLIRDCYENGVGVFDFSIGDEEYKYEWTDVEVAATTFVSANPMGAAFVAVKKGKIKAVEMLRKMKGLRK